MNIEKIKLAIGEHLWNHWQNEHNVEQLKKAESTLRHEIEIGLRREYKDFAEHELLCKRLGINVQLCLTEPPIKF